MCLSPPFSLPFLAFLFYTEHFPFYRAKDRSQNPPLLPSPLRHIPRVFQLPQSLVQDPSLLTNQHIREAAMSVWTHRSSCNHGPTKCWAVPLLGNGASERAEDMLGQTVGDHCTDVCYYSNYCSNHGNAKEDWSGLHCYCHRVCHRGRRRSQRWVCAVTRWVGAINQILNSNSVKVRNEM